MLALSRLPQHSFIRLRFESGVPLPCLRGSVIPVPGLPWASIHPPLTDMRVASSIRMLGLGLEMSPGEYTVSLWVTIPRFLLYTWPEL